MRVLGGLIKLNLHEGVRFMTKDGYLDNGCDSGLSCCYFHAPVTGKGILGEGKQQAVPRFTVADGQFP